MQTSVFDAVRDQAHANLEALRRNPYPGRGIVMGLDDEGACLVLAYWIMGRSENSRNRVFEYNVGTGRLFTKPADPAKMKDPSLVVYNAMIEWSGCHIVSNGHQTDAIARGMADGGYHCGFFDVMREDWTYEPDAPHYTPRIAAVYWMGSHSMGMAILRKSARGDACERNFYCFDELGEGLGFCLTTYSGDGDPLPAFRGEPYLLPLEGDLAAISVTLWDALNPKNKVSLAVKVVNLESGISMAHVFNKYMSV